MGQKENPQSIDELVRDGRTLLSQEPRAIVAHNSFNEWDIRVANWLDECFPDSGLSAEWSSLSWSPFCGQHGPRASTSEWREYNKVVQTRLGWLAKIPRYSVDKEEGKSKIVSNKVFIVHGHDDGSKQAVARFLEKLKLEPIILHERPNQGRTIIEKFEDYSDVSCAVVLLTDDDLGKQKETDNKSNDLKPRARQNVIFEMGFFIGQIGRKRVFALHREGVELPSDYDGVLYIQYDSSGKWNLELAKEIKATGLKVDLNDVV